MFYDTHSHSQFSFDGKRTSVKDSAASAIGKGLGGICFTDHCDFLVPAAKAEFEPVQDEVFDVPAQQAEIDAVNASIIEGAYGRTAARKFRIFKGAEIGMNEKARPEIDAFLSRHDFDQVTGSVHYLDDADPYHGDSYYKGKNWKEAYGHYLETIVKEAKWLGKRVDIIGHFDYIARYAPYIKESVLYKDFPGQFDELLRFLADNGKGLEINTKTYGNFGLRKPVLDKDILIRYLEFGGEVITLGADAHDPERVGDKFEYYSQFVKACGFRYLAHFERHKPKMATI